MNGYYYSKHFGDDLPEYYHVVLNVEMFDEESNEYKVKKNDFWTWCILGRDGECIQPSPENCPLIGSSFRIQENVNHYKLTVCSFYYLEQAQLFVETFCKSTKDVQDFAFKVLASAHTDFTVEELEDTIEYYYNSTEPVKKKPVQTKDQRVLQSLISKNATEIHTLERKLQELRLIQKGLKAQR